MSSLSGKSMIHHTSALMLTTALTGALLVGCLDFSQFDCFQSSSGCNPIETDQLDNHVNLNVTTPDVYVESRSLDQGPPKVDQSAQDQALEDIMMRDLDSAQAGDAHVNTSGLMDLGVIDMNLPIVDQSLIPPRDMQMLVVVDAMSPTPHDPRLEVNTHTRSWQGGYCRDVIFRNTSDEVINEWSIQLEVQGSVYHVWNAHHLVEREWVTFTPLDWNRSVIPNLPYSFGFCARD